MPSKTPTNEKTSAGVASTATKLLSNPRTSAAVSRWEQILLKQIYCSFHYTSFSHELKYLLATNRSCLYSLRVS
jgi:hypothetical protein